MTKQGDEYSSSKPASFEQLASSYPLIFRAYLHPEEYPMCVISERGFECWIGWYDIIDELSAWLERKAQDFLRQGCQKIPLVVQCKEKFSSLRYYVREIPESQAFRDELSHRINLAYERSCSIQENEDTSGDKGLNGVCSPL